MKLHTAYIMKWGIAVTKRVIYADNAAQKPLIPEVKEVIRKFLDSDYGNPSALYSSGRNARKAIEEAREKVAKAIGANADEIFFTSGSTESINWVIGTVGAKVAITPIEHKAIINAAKNNDNRLLSIPVDSCGVIDLVKLHDLCDGVTLVAVGYANNEIGTIQPVKDIVTVCKKAGARLFIDATQVIGHIPINVHDIGCDYMCGSFHKLGGLAGCGFLYCRKGSPIYPYIYGGSQERTLRGGTENLLGILTGTVAIEEATKDIDMRMSKIQVKRDKIISEFFKLPKTHLNGSLCNRLAGNINICFEGIEAESLVLQLDLDGIRISAGSACNSTSIEPSHVLTAIGLSPDMARASIRITIDDMSDEDVDYLIDRVKYRVEQFRNNSPLWGKIKDD